MVKKNQSLNKDSFAGLVSVVMLVFLAYSLSQYPTDPKLYSPQTNSTQWNTYSNPDVDIIFDYPKSYSISERIDQDKNHTTLTLFKIDESTLPKNAESPPAISFDIFRDVLHNENVISWMKKEPISNFALSDGTYRQTKLQDIDIITYQWSGLYEGITILFSKGTDVYMGSVGFFSIDDDLVKDFKKILQSVSLR